MHHEQENERREQAEKGAFKIVDRRRFTATGDIRADAPADAGPKAASPIVQHKSEQPPQAPATANTSASTSADADASTAAKRSASSVDFLSFISSLATNAMAAMGLLPPSQSRGMPQNLNMAREYIEIIVMLQERTAGNLSPDEDSAMTQLISDLGGQYVKLQRASAPVIPAPLAL